MFQSSVSRSIVALSALGVVSLLMSQVAGAAQFASTVVEYDKGDYAGAYQTPAGAVASPDSITGEGFGYPNILSPFSPAFDTDEIVGIGKGGHLTLSFSTPIPVSPIVKIGVFTNVGLNDTFEDFPNAVNTTPAATLGGVRAANIEISADGVTWSDLSRRDFTSPTNYFANAANPYLSATPSSPVLADFGKPFKHPLPDFDGLNWSQTLSLLDGSAGGDWIDVPGDTTLTSFTYVRFSIPDAGYLDTDSTAFFDAVSISSVPEPTGLVLLGAVATLLRRRRTR